MKKAILTIGGLVGLLALYYWSVSDRPAYYETQQLVHSEFQQFHHVNTTQAETETVGLVTAAQKSGRVPDVSTVRAAFHPSAERANDLVNEEKAWEDTASGRATNHPRQVVYGYMNAWRDSFVQHEPALVTFGHELICSGSNPSECTDAAGSDKSDKSYKTVLQDWYPDSGGTKDGAAGRFRAVIARVRGDGGDYTAPLETGFAAAICRPGTTQLRTNVWAWYGPVKTSQNTAGNSGEISFQKSVGDPLAIAACKAHPDQAIVPIDPTLVSK